MSEKLLDIRGRLVGPGQPCFVIAEAGVNHNGNLDLARQLVDQAAAAGADAVKFQTFKAIRLAAASAKQAAYQRRNIGKTESQVEMLKRLELSEVDHHELVRHCAERSIVFMSTPFEEQSADFLNQIDVPVFKLPSGELTNLEFLQYVAKFGRPLIVSTGMSHLGEVDEAVRALESGPGASFALLHCVSNYPAEPADTNLRAMETMRRAYGVPVGYSDHTLGLEVSYAAVALGACIVEKHFTLDRTLPGPDHAASLEPDELAQLVRGIRIVESSLGNGRKLPCAAEMNTAAVARKSVVAATDIPVGTRITADLLTMQRPGTGLPPNMKQHIIGMTARTSIAAGTLIELEMVA